MALDLYLRLGVNRNADKDSIKRAYRKIAKSCHPDMDGECGDAGRFRDLQEAYETLSDSEKRRAYDARLENEEGESSIPIRRRGYAPGADATARPSDGKRRADDLWGSYFSGNHPSRDHGRGPVHLEAILSPKEAAEGGSVTLPIDVVSRCPWCGDAFLSLLIRRRCASCGGTGRIHQVRHLPFHIPAGVRHGAVLTLNDPSLPGTRVRVRILIDG